ncbi:type I-B CRISPR-associated protein Cas8b1/Cst1 [Parabacteroides sp. 52]|uniref:type I-B CRISPR-associated protein Cas8b1/Cst1 n=1 Tax=unclassified Parabacteroides TaxID=2649774 RepID=UPI0013D89474|nr:MULTISPECIES: type I-B CRISPR-associated protein Cas8b1/Cst1 [unclassified Parabacteroides]MDH6535002.1 CRISPR-associated protein Cst1 [Parabacteroides sp. PM5-20]NDV55262.1 type I-B CRISPR-associated protein Cas8b1/Cst1 [Parabacteroides sp. 52]
MSKIENIDRYWLTTPTGDPFADIGGYVLEYLMELWPDLSVMEMIRKVTHIYVGNWDNNLHSFFLNSTITHNSNKGQKGIDKTLGYYQGLIDEVGAVEGYCRITGQKGEVFPAARDNHIMSGSATLINFHHGYEAGIMLSKEALIRIFFVPLGVEQLGDKVAAIISNKEEVTRFFVRKNVDSNIRNLGSGMSKSILKSDFSNPTNALFDYALQCINNIDTAIVDADEYIPKEQITLNLFHFTNFGAKPTISLYRLPATVFFFYKYCVIHHAKEWQDFVYRNYWNTKFKNATYNEVGESWSSPKETVDYQTFKVWRNNIFDKLTEEKSILKYILKYIKLYPFSFKIVEIYQINIMHMDKRTLDKIKELAFFVVDERNEDGIKDNVKNINLAKTSSELSRSLIKLLKENYELGNKAPLFTLEEYVYYLFPDGTSWRDIRNLLLIAIYDELHKRNLQIETNDEGEDEDEDTND